MLIGGVISYMLGLIPMLVLVEPVRNLGQLDGNFFYVASIFPKSDERRTLKV
jgi:hypothetical protein